MMAKMVVRREELCSIS